MVRAYEAASILHSGRIPLHASGTLFDKKQATILSKFEFEYEIY